MAGLSSQEVWRYVLQYYILVCSTVLEGSVPPSVRKIVTALQVIHVVTASGVKASNAPPTMSASTTNVTHLPILTLPVNIVIVSP